MGDLLLDDRVFRDSYPGRVRQILLSISLSLVEESGTFVNFPSAGITKRPVLSRQVFFTHRVKDLDCH
jgi:hypothetical protein